MLSENLNALEKAKFVDYQGNTAIRVFVVNPSSGGSSSVTNFGIENLINGQDYATIVFENAMSNNGYAVLVAIESNDDDPIFLNYLIKNKTVNGMTIKLNAPVDSSNYFLSWVVLDIL